jgi:hypothetical protein
MNKQQAELIAYIVTIVFTVLVLGLIALIQPYFEMKTFNRCTGSNATFQDAMFAQLRVEKCL